MFCGSLFFVTNKMQVSQFKIQQMLEFNEGLLVASEPFTVGHKRAAFAPETVGPQQIKPSQTGGHTFTGTKYIEKG